MSGPARPPAAGDDPGEPTEEELAAIVAAYEALWPKPVVAVGPAEVEVPRWRFSGRWWSKPVALRRGRPG